MSKVGARVATVKSLDGEVSAAQGTRLPELRTVDRSIGKSVFFERSLHWAPKSLNIRAIGAMGEKLLPKEPEDCGTGALPYKVIRDVSFFRVSFFQHNFLDLV